MKKFILIIIISILPGMCFSGDWTKTDIAYEAAVLIPKYFDYKQTYWSVGEDGHRETMPFMFDEYPSKHRMNCYFAGTAILHVAIMHVVIKYDILSPKKRKWLQIPLALVSGRNIIFNIKHGTKLHP